MTIACAQSVAADPVDGGLLIARDVAVEEGGQMRGSVCGCRCSEGRARNT
jgi:hypothetical protein